MSNQADITAKINTLLPDLTTHQTNYQTRNGRYQQFKAADDVLAQFNLSPLTGVTFTVDEYDGPQGAGFVINATYDQDGERWSKMVGYGPESRDQDWYSSVINP